MSSQLLQSELRSLSVEARKKHPAVKEAAERGIVKLRAIDNQQSGFKSVIEDKNDDLLRPFLLAFESGNPKLTVLSVSCLQKLISHHAMSPDVIPFVLEMLSSNADTDDASVQLKILQSILSLLSAADTVHGPPLASALCICFKYHKSDNIMLQNTAAVAVRQLTGTLFDRAQSKKGDEDTESSSSSTASSQSLFVEDAFNLFLDLCLACNGEPCRWLDLDELDANFGLELIETCLEGHVDLVEENDEFTALLKDRACPLLIKFFSDKFNFPLQLRLMRILTLLLIDYHGMLSTEIEIFMSLVFRTMDVDNSWQCALALEMLQQAICAKSPQTNILLHFYRQYDADDNSCNLFEDLMRKLSKIVRENFDSSQELRVTVVLGKYSLLSHLNDVEVPAWNEETCVSMAIECLLMSIQTMDQLMLKHLETGGENQGSAELLECLCKMMSGSWPSFLSALSTLVSDSDDVSLVQHACKGFQSATNIASHLGLSTPRDAFLTSVRQMAMNGSTSAQELSMKNTQALKTLLNIGHGMGGQLGSSWKLVLESFEFLETVLRANAISSTGAFDKHALSDSGSLSESSGSWTGGSGGALKKSASHSSMSSEDGMESELSILAIGMQGIFEGSRYLDDQALVDLIEALLELSNGALKSSNGMEGSSGAGTPRTRANKMHSGGLGGSGSSLVGSPAAKSSTHVETNDERLFAASKLVEVALNNMHRLQHVWTLIIDHILFLSGSGDVDIRVFAVDGLCQLIGVAIGNTNNASGVSTMSLETSQGEAEGQTETDIDMHSQQMILEPMFALSMSPYLDVREKMLSELFHLLENNGQLMSSGWGSILPLLKNVSRQSTNAAELQVAFKSIQLMCTDFLHTVPIDSLADCVAVVSEFGGNGCDLNISLTSINLLWTFADFVQERSEQASQNSDDQGGSQGASQSAGGNNGGAGDFWQDLWLSLFRQLYRLALDSRSEVRNSALRTLFSTLNSHGKALDDRHWTICTWEILFALLDSVDSQANELGTDQVVEAELGKEKGKSVMMLVHHSRNTHGKQWNETRVLALAGVARVIKIYFVTLRRLDRFDEGWTKILKIIQESAGSESNEIALSAIQCLRDCMEADAGEEGIGQHRWEQALNVWQALINEAASKRSLRDNVIDGMLVGLRKLYTNSRASFSNDQVLTLIDWLHQMSLVCMQATKPHLITQNQNALLALVKQLPPFDCSQQDDLWHHHFDLLLGFVVPLESGKWSNGSGEQEGMLYCTPFAVKALKIIGESFGECPAECSGRAFADLASALGAFALDKYEPNALGHKLWKPSLQAYIEVLRYGLVPRTMNGQLTSEEIESLWKQVTRTVLEVLQPNEEAKAKWNKAMQEEQRQQAEEASRYGGMMMKPSSDEDSDEKLEAEMIVVIAQCMIQCAAQLPQESFDAMMHLFEEGSKSGNGQGMFVQACFNAYFCLSNASESSDEQQMALASKALKVVLERSLQVIHANQDGQQEGQEEMCFVLGRLAELETHRDIVQNVVGELEMDIDVSNVRWNLYTSKAHLGILYGTFCELIESGSSPVRKEVKRIFEVIGKDVGL